MIYIDEEANYVHTDWNTEVRIDNVSSPLQKPHICPVCGGKGLVPAGFYNLDYYTYTYTTCPPQPETCRTCNGRGIVWGE